MDIIIYRAYTPGHYEFYKPLPYLRNGETIHPPMERKWIPPSEERFFIDKNKCIEYCVEHGLQFEPIEIED